MKLLTTIFVFAIIVTKVAIASDVPCDLLPPCEGRACYVIAENVSIEEPIEAHDLKVRIGNFVAKIPPNITKVDIHNTPDGLTVFSYETTPNIVLSMETHETFRIKELTQKPMSLLEAMEIIFIKNPKDSDIARTYGNECLNKLMWIKKSFLDKSNEAYIYSKRNLKIYYAPKGGEPYKNIAWAIDKNNPNSALRLESDLNKNEFVKILYSISTLKAKDK